MEKTHALKALSGMVWQVRQLLRTMRPEDYNIITQANKRSIGQFVYHLCYFESLYFAKVLRRLAFDPKLDISSFEDDDSGGLKLTEADVRSYMAYLCDERYHNIKLLSDFALFDTERRFIHTVHGVLSVEDIVKKVLIHDERHCKQMAEVIKSL